MRFLASTSLFFIALACAGSAQASPYLGSHAILYPDTPLSAKAEMFRQARASGADTIRLDLTLLAIYRQGDYQGQIISETDWSSAEEYAALARRYQIKPLIVLYGTPWFIADCPTGVSKEDSYHCPPSDYQRYQAMISELAGRYRGLFNDYEILNEPDHPRFFYGSASDYGRMLAAAADAIHQGNPEASVFSGGLSKVNDHDFFDQVLAATPQLAERLDGGAIHIRSSARGVVLQTKEWDNYFKSKGIDGPLWVTEYGYPAADVFQNDPRYRGGEQMQAEFIQATLPKMLGAGADKIFITLRDWDSGRFASEGLLEVADPLTADPVVRRRPAFAAVAQLATNLAPSEPFPAPGVMTVQNPGKRLKINQGRVSLTFTCPGPGDCSWSRFILQSRGRQMKFSVSSLVAGRSQTSQILLTNRFRQRLGRSSKARLLTRDGRHLAHLRLSR